jgi:hypothetical protein
VAEQLHPEALKYIAAAGVHLATAARHLEADQPSEARISFKACLDSIERARAGEIDPEIWQQLQGCVWAVNLALVNRGAVEPELLTAAAARLSGLLGDSTPRED